MSSPSQSIWQVGFSQKRGAYQKAARLGQYLEKPRGYHGEWSPYESPKAKTRGAAGPKGFGRGTSQGTPFTIIHPIQPMDSLGTQLENGEGTKPYILVELHPNIQGHDAERTHCMLFNLLKTNTFFTLTALVIINILCSLFVYK